MAALQDDARREYDLARLTWAVLAGAGAKVEPPKVPPILERDP